MKIPVAIKVLRENTSPKANKEILDVSPSTLSVWEYRRDPPWRQLLAVVSFSLRWSLGRHFVIPKSKLNLSGL